MRRQPTPSLIHHTAVLLSEVPLGGADGAVTMPRVRRAQGVEPDACLWLCRAHGLPLPVREYRFDPVRRWRFDYAWPDRLVALEQEGGVWTQGRHVRPLGVLKDIEKYNAATLAGWSVFRATPQQIRDATIVPILQQVLR